MMITLSNGTFLKEILDWAQVICETYSTWTNCNVFEAKWEKKSCTISETMGSKSGGSRFCVYCVVNIWLCTHRYVNRHHLCQHLQTHTHIQTAPKNLINLAAAFFYLFWKKRAKKQLCRASAGQQTPLPCFWFVLDVKEWALVGI